MGVLVTDVTAMVRQMAPLHTSRWTDAVIKKAIHIADMEIREEAEVEWATDTISLVQSALYYSLPDDMVELRSVEYLRDGSTFDCMLQAIAMPEMDDVSLSWQDDTGTTPMLYSVLSVPGCAKYSKIMVWPAPPATTGSAIRVNYTKYRKTANELDGLEMPDDVMRSVYLPRVLAHLMAQTDVAEANAYMDEFYSKLPMAKARYTNQAA